MKWRKHIQSPDGVDVHVYVTLTRQIQRNAASELLYHFVLRYDRM